MAITKVVTEYTGVVPNRSQPEVEFEANVPNFLNYMDGLSIDINEWADQLNTTQIEINTSETNAANSALAAESVSGLANYRGSWSSGETYAQGESVLFNSTYWISDIDNNIGNTPADDANWSSIASLQELTGKADLSGADFTGTLTTLHNTVTSTANSLVIDCSTGNHFTHVLTENTTISFTNVPTTNKAYLFGVDIIQDAGASGFVVTWPAGILWPAGSAPTLTTTASAVDKFGFSVTDGSTVDSLGSIKDVKGVA